MNKKKKDKTKSKKHNKMKLTEEYGKSEAEVSVSSMQVQKRKEIDTEHTIENGIDFFIENVEGNNDNKIIEEADRVSESENKSVLSVSESASLYIQIENFESPIKKIDSIKMYYSDNLFYTPSSRELLLITLANDFEEKGQYELLEKHGLYITKKFQIHYNSNMIRMVNRYSQEGHLEFIKSPVCLKNQQQQIANHISKTFKTECQKKFMPVLNVFKFLQNSNIEIPPRKHLSIILKELIFIQHPLQTEEHCLAIKLEHLYNAYNKKISNNYIRNITTELNAVREIIAKMIKGAENINIRKFEDYMLHAKQLRNTLHKEELEIKNLIKSVLDTWLSLKSLRKRQGINYTNIKLRIQIEETDKEAEEILLEERFRIELNEVLREEFETYYNNKRNVHHRDREGKKSSITRSLSLQKPDVEVIKANLRDTLIKCTKAPGEPKVTLGIEYIDGSSTKIPLKMKPSYYFKIFFGDRYLSSSKNFKLKKDFKIILNEIFAIYLEKIPQNIKIEIFEKTKVQPDTKIAEMFLTLSQFIDYTLGHDETIEFSSKNNEIAGALKVAFHFGTGRLEGNSIDYNSIHDGSVDRSSKQYVHMKNDSPHQSYDNELLNPSDPDSLSAIKYSNVLKKNHERMEQKTEDTFFVFDEEFLTFCSEDEISNSLHYKNNMRYKHLSFIPSVENEVEEAGDEKVIESGGWVDPIDLQRYRGKKYLQKLYNVILDHCNLLNKHEDSSNLLINDEPPTLRSVFQAILGLITFNRSLLSLNLSTPERISIKSDSICKFNVLVNVVRATGIPIRNFGVSDRRSSFPYQNFKYSNVRPFVSVIYKNKRIRTTTAEGSNPTWNEQLVLEISGKPSELWHDIKILLFDEYLEDLLNDDLTKGMEFYQRIHMNYLGELRIPLNTIFLRKKIEGVFEMNSPKIILGYTRPTLDPTNGVIPIENVPQIRESTFLVLHINIEPQFELPSISTSCLECSELKEVKSFVQEWCVEVKENFPNRFLHPLISLASGKTVCITRLLEPIPIPLESRTENLREVVTRYVSLIPILRAISACTALNGIWLNNQIILETTWASPKDLGVLLACFYLNLGIRAYLILGIAFPYGETTFVLIKEGSSISLVDPSTSKIYSNGDVSCPLEEVFYVISMENVYCNIQTETRVSMTDFNIKDTSNWLPLFNRNNPAPISGVHKLSYNIQLNKNNSVVELRKNIESKIMKKINSWRSTRKTIWNKEIGDILYEHLCDLEDDVILGRSNCNNSERIAQRIQTHHKLFGVTLNFPYTNLSSISDRIKSVGIHLNTDGNIEFANAVHIRQYPNNILSIWIFLTSMVPISN